MSNFFRRLFAFFLALSLVHLSSAASVDYKVRNAPGASTADTYLAIRNEIAKAAVQKRDLHSSNATIEKRWVDATLLKLGHERTAGEIQARPIDVGGSVEVICTECYVKGFASASLNISFLDNATHVRQVISNFTDEVVNITTGFTEYTINYLEEYFTGFDNFSEVLDIAGNLIDGGPSWDDLELPTFNYPVDLDIPEVPECTLKFQFDGLELYMALNTVIEAGATYELPIFISETVAGIAITPDLFMGLFFTIDLILSLEGEIDISSGFHIKLDDGIAIQIALFGNEVSDIEFPGGKFEFLPVEVESAGVVFKAVLRLGIFAGFDITTSPKLGPLDKTGNALASLMPDVSGGIEVGIFANVAEFITNITYTPDEDCKLNVVQSYQLALGAKAGATVAIGSNTWGPMPETSVPVWYTEMGSLCAVAKTPATVSSDAVTTAISDRKRQDLVTTTITQEFIHTGVNCLSVGLVNCPVSLQNTSQSIETRTLVTALPPGSKATFPVTVMSTVASPIAFLKGAMTIPATQGSPVSYIPPAPTSSSKFDDFVSGVEGAAGDALDDAEDALHEVGKNKKLIIGLSVGLGVPFLLAIAAGLILLFRRRAVAADLATGGAYSDPQSGAKMLDTPSMLSPTTPRTLDGYMDYKAVKSMTVEETEVGAPSPRY